MNDPQFTIATILALVAAILGAVFVSLGAARAAKQAGREQVAEEREYARLTALVAKYGDENDEEAPPTLEGRLTDLERRLPARVPDQLATVNEAVLAVKLEHLELRLKAPEDNKLERWDVFLIVGAVIGVFGGAVTLVLAIVRWLA